MHLPLEYIHICIIITGDDMFADPVDHPQTLGDAAMATTGGVPPIAGYPLTNPAIGCLEYAWLAPSAVDN